MGATALDLPARPHGWLGRWFQQRNMRYLERRLLALLRRYGWTTARAEARTLRFVHLLASEGCAPTFATPGSVVFRHPAFIQRLQALGVEIAVHSYDHLDLRSLDPDDRRTQLARAVRAFHLSEIDVTGFRAPYLGYEPGMRDAVPSSVRYSSNAAVSWPVLDVASPAHPDVFSSLSRFYDPRPAVDGPVLPEYRAGLLEIPVSVPDDLQCLDGIGTGVTGLAEAWCRILRESHTRGDVFVALTHPEAADESAAAIRELLQMAHGLTPAVWIARLIDIADWWEERRQFVVDEAGPLLRVRCTERATVLLRGPGPEGVPWSDGYRVLHERIFDFGGPLPFVGLAVDRPVRELEAALAAEGFVVQVGQAASRCATVLDQATVTRLGDATAVVEHLERIAAPLLRFWRWPDGARSALSITGDLDALSLADYAARLSRHRGQGM